MISSEPSVQLNARVPLSLTESAAERARQLRPGICKTGIIRLALARLAGLPDDLADPLPMGPKAKQTASDT